MTGLVEEVRSLGKPKISWIDKIVAWTGQPGANLRRNAHEWGR